MADAIDHSLYPDTAAPDDLRDQSVAADYVQRVCGAYDFGIVPSGDMLATLRGLRAVFDRFPLPASPAYHALRRWYGWPSVPALPAPELRSEHFDRRDDREPEFMLI